VTGRRLRAQVALMIAAVVGLRAAAGHAAARVESIPAPAGTRRAIWFEHRTRCHKVFKTSH